MGDVGFPITLCSHQHGDDSHGHNQPGRNGLQVKTIPQILHGVVDFPSGSAELGLARVANLGIVFCIVLCTVLCMLSRGSLHDCPLRFSSSSVSCLQEDHAPWALRQLFVKAKRLSRPTQASRCPFSV